MPVDGPAPSPTPQPAPFSSHRSSATPCSSAVDPSPRLRVVPAAVTSPPARTLPAKGRVAAQTQARPWLERTDPGSDASAPEPSMATVGAEYRKAGGRISEAQ